MSKVKTGITMTKINKKIIQKYVKEKGCSLGYFLEESAMMQIEREQNEENKKRRYHSTKTNGYKKRREDAKNDKSYC